MPVITTETLTLLTPHIVDLVRTVFRSRNKGGANDKSPQAASVEQAVDILSRDVSELQEVATKHGSAITEIAQKVDARLGELERQLKRQQIFSLISIVVAVIAVGIAIAR